MPATTSTTGFTLGATATTSTTGFTLGAAVATTTAGFTLGIPSTSTTTGFSLDKSATTATIASSASATVPTTTTVTTSSLPVSKFSQLEENINKWTIELEEQEKVFMNQVAHINEWDRLLLSNGDKIVALNNSVEKVKLEQQQLDHELDFIVAQQRELEECLLPLEKEFADITVSDPERDATYRLAENLNTQLRHMSEDLKEIIEDINEKNKNQDITDPIVQIGRILNAHMNSLQWVDQNTTLIKQQLDQVTKLTEIHRRENDSTQNL
ncbi:UNVERIFIED_CONTAM: hypothetical protein PYX00_000235 [Menopon gallinae]|uniref:Nucleoporin NSP1-like C-terminal domain-containing protein n=1 Tax=Menopon gallinae TaxID=328185 RepID=A0AAW2I9L4_9NEOP